MLIACIRDAIESYIGRNKSKGKIRMKIVKCTVNLAFGTVKGVGGEG